MVGLRFLSQQTSVKSMHPPASIRCSRFAAHHPIFVRCTLTSRLGKRSLIQFPKCHTRVGENPSFFDFSTSDLFLFPPSVSFIFDRQTIPSQLFQMAHCPNRLALKLNVELINAAEMKEPQPPFL